MNKLNHHYIVLDHEQVLLWLLLTKVAICYTYNNNNKQYCLWVNYSQRHAKIRSQKGCHLMSGLHRGLNRSWTLLKRNGSSHVQKTEVQVSGESSGQSRGFWHTALDEASEKDRSS